MIKENKVAKYLLYAIGEIVLVVIGILIALNLNNSSQRKASEAKIDVILSEVMEELSSNIGSIDNIMRHYSVKDTIYSLLRKKSLTYQDYNENRIPGLFGYTRNRETISLSQYAFDNLILNMDAIPIKYNDVLKDLRFLNNDIKKEVYDFDERMKEYVEKNIDYQLLNFAWFSESNSLQEQRDKKINYMLNDSIYRNVAQRYNNIGEQHLSHSLNYRKKAIDCYLKIANLLNKPTIDDSFRFDSDLAKILPGEWESEQFPSIIATVYVADNRLFYKNNTESFVGEFFHISKTKFVDVSGSFFTVIKKENDYTLVNQTKNIIWTKIKE